MGYAILQKASEPMAKRLNEAIDFMVQNMPKENFDVLERAVRILEEGYKNKEPSPFAKQFTEITTKWMEKEFEKDMIYYSICYDGFRI
jgi:hypothetical protein